MNDFIPIYFDVELQQFVAREKNNTNISNFKAEITVESAVWQLTHNQDTFNVIVQTYKDGIFIEPDNIKLVDSNSVTVSFSTPITGEVKLITF